DRWTCRDRGELLEQVVRQRHPGLRRARLERAMDWIRHVLDLDELGHANSMISYIRHDKRIMRAPALIPARASRPARARRARARSRRRRAWPTRPTRR